MSCGLRPRRDPARCVVGRCHSGGAASAAGNGESSGPRVSIAGTSVTEVRSPGSSTVCAWSRDASKGKTVMLGAAVHRGGFGGVTFAILASNATTHRLGLRPPVVKSSGQQVRSATVVSSSGNRIGAVVCSQPAQSQRAASQPAQPFRFLRPVATAAVKHVSLPTEIISQIPVRQPVVVSIPLRPT